MNTIKKLSSTLKSQLGVISVGPQPPSSHQQHQHQQHQHIATIGDGGSRLDIAAACEKLLDSSTEGEIFFKTDGKFHSFVLRVEDAVVAALLDHFPPDDLPQATGAFITRAVQYCADFDPMDSAYAASHIGAIRSSVRAIASKEPGRILDHVDAIFATVSAACGVSLTNLNDSALRRDAQCLRKLSHAQLSYLPLRDDPFANVFHPAPPSPSSSSGAAVPSRLCITGCGSDEVQGVYALTPRRGGDNYTDARRPPEYRHSAGYVITRTKKALSVQWEEASDGDGDDNDGIPPALVVYEWSVSHPRLATAYYCCCTPDPTPVPPALGWRQAGPLGRLPGPQLTVADTDPGAAPGERDENGQSAPAGSAAAAAAVVPPFRAPLVPSTAAASKQQGLRVGRAKSQAQASAETARAGAAVDGGRRSSTGGAVAALELYLEHDEAATPAAVAKALGHGPAGGLGRAPTDAALQQLRHDCEALLAGGEGAAQLQLLLGKCKGVETALKQKATAIAQKIEWLGAADTDALVAGLLAATDRRLSPEDERDDADSEALPPAVAAAAAAVGAVGAVGAAAATASRPQDSSFVAPRRPHARRADDDLDDGPAAATDAWGDVAIRTRARPPTDAAAPPPPSLTQPASPPSPSPRDRRALIFPSDVGTGNVHGRASQSPARSGWHAAGGAPPSPQRRLPGGRGQAVDAAADGSYADAPHTPRLNRHDHDYRDHHDGSDAGVGHLRQDPDASMSNDSADSSMTLGALSGVGWGGSVVSSASFAAAVSATGLERRAPFAVGGLASVSAEETAPRIQTFCSALMDVAFERTGRGANSYADVQVLGVEVRPWASEGGVKAAPGDEERVHYVIRASMREYLYTSTRPQQQHQQQQQQQQAAANALSPSASIGGEEPRRRSSSSASVSASASPGVLQQQPRRVFTVRRDLTSLCAFHAELVEAIHQLRASADWPSLTAPAFPDAFAMGTIDEQLLVRHAAAAAAAAASGSGGGGSFFSPSSWGGGGGAARAAASAFAYTSRLRAAWLQKAKGKGAKPKEGLLAAPPTKATKAATLRVEDRVDAAAGQLQTYLHAVFALVEAADERAAAAAAPEHPLPAALGRLVGRFLLSAEGLDEVQGAVSRASAAGQERQRRRARRPCWYTHSSGGLCLRLTVTDDFGGRLSLHSDDEMLKLQRARCMGCGEPLTSGFLGLLDRNYQPCRFSGGLFCRKWCHGDDYRHIPHRLLRYWDHKPHRVCRQAAAFLDRLWKRPLLLVGTINPLLHEGVPALRLAKNMRRRALQHVVRILDADFDGEADAVRDAALTLLGPGRVHLCLADDLYSMADLVGVHSREVQPALERLLVVLRSRDRTVGLGLGPGPNASPARSTRSSGNRVRGGGRTSGGGGDTLQSTSADPI